MTFFFHLFYCLIPYKNDLVYNKKYSISVYITSAHTISRYHICCFKTLDLKHVSI